MFSVILCIRKSGFHIDEIYTFGLSNSHFAPFLNNLFGGSLTDNVVTKQDFLNYLTVAPNSRFDFASVFYNQSIDVHPPLHYCIINTISSLFTGVFSKWIGLSVNLVFQTVTLVLIYKTALLLKCGRRISALSVAVYGLSQIALSSFLMIRMYALSTMLTALLVYVTVKVNIEARNYRYFFIVLTVYLGAMTHYNFIIFAFFLTVAYDLYLIINKKLPQLIKFSVAALTGIALMLLSFPYVIDQFTAKKLVSGETALSFLLSISKWFGKIGFYSAEFVFGIPLLFLLFAEAVFIIILSEKKKKSLARCFNSVTFVIAVAMLLSFLCIAITSPAHTARYICHLVPVAAILLAKALKKASDEIYDEHLVKYKAGIKRLCVPAVLVFGIICSSVLITPNYIYSEHKEFDRKAAMYSSSPCVVFSKEEVNCLTNNTPQLINFDTLLITNRVTSDKLKEYIAEHNAKSLVVCIEEKAYTGNTSFLPEEILSEFTEAFPSFSNPQPLYTKGNGGAGTYSVYILSKKP